MENTQMRDKFLRLCMKKKMSMSSIIEITNTMRGKTKEEKEAIAEKAIKDLHLEE